MTGSALRALVAGLVVGGALLLTGLFLFVPVAGGARDAAVSLLTLSWTSAATVVRSLFRTDDPRG